jgi:hypothetical protein
MFPIFFQVMGKSLRERKTIADLGGNFRNRIRKKILGKQ